MVRNHLQSSYISFLKADYVRDLAEPNVAIIQTAHNFIESEDDVAWLEVRALHRSEKYDPIASGAVDADIA